MACNRLQRLKLLSGKNKKQNEKDILILVAIAFPEKAGKRDITALQDVQTQDKNIGTKASSSKALGRQLQHAQVRQGKAASSGTG